MTALRLIGGEDLVSRGEDNLQMLRPVLPRNADLEAMFTANATLRKDEWERVDERINRVLRERLTIADDLRGRGLVESVSLGTILRITERIEDFDTAEISYDGDTSPQADRPSFLRDVRPVPVISKDFKINWRQLEASRMRGDPLDTSSAELAARKVRDRLQALIVNGHTAGPDGNDIPGLITATNRVTVDLVNVWDGASGDPVGDVNDMLAAAFAVNLFGPFFLYVPKNYWANLQEDHKAESDRMVMERLMAYSEVEAIRPLDALPDDNVVLVQMTRDVLDLSEAQSVTTVQWEKNPFVTNFRVLTVAGPQIKSIETEDGDTVNGIVHLRPAP